MEEGIVIHLAAEKVTELFGIPITNTLITSWLTIALLAIIAILVGRRVKIIPGKLQLMFEEMFSWVINFMAETLEDRKLAEKFFPLIMSMFLFILFGNLLGLFPGIGSITIIKEVHGHIENIALFHPINTDLNVTLAMTIIAFLVIEISGVVILGALKYGSKFVNFKSVIGFLVGIIELFSEIARLISFSFRLFGNMFAGKTLILVVMFFVPYILPVPLMLFEAFVGFIQAAIFALLTLFFIKIAIAEPH